MAADPETPVGQARQGVNWLVGLSGGAVGSALLRLDWVLKFPAVAKWVFLLAATCFLASIAFGVFYAFELFALAQRKESLADLSNPANPEKKDEAARSSEISSAKVKVSDANAKVHRFHDATFGTFVVASLLSIGVFYLVLFDCPDCKTPDPPTPHPAIYVIDSTLTYVAGKPAHSHIFLLNQETGEMWEMVCQKAGLVEFRPVDKLTRKVAQVGPPNPSSR